jgi:hypothetical protein
MDFQPLFMAGHSLRKVDRSHWTVVQKAAVPMKRPVCCVCGFVAETKRSLVHADEVWSFPGSPIVHLVEVRPLCVDCHDAKDYADLLRRVMVGKASASRSLSVIFHYCRINNCDLTDFDNDFRAALIRRQEIEALYRYNFDRKLAVDYGKWDRPPETPRLNPQAKAMLRSLYKDRDEPIVLGERSLSSFGAAVRYLQSLSLESRAAALRGMVDAVSEERDEEDPLVESDEGVQFS